jgi:hypothetical protein
MGIYFGRNSIKKTESTYETQKVSKFDPNPANFEILNSIERFGNVALYIKYPNCKNYEGNKILVYKGVGKNQIVNLKEIDPHFSDDGSLSPVARFEPTQRGWILAMILLEVLKDY